MRVFRFQVMGIAGGLILFLAGLYGALESAWFSWWGERTNAIAVGLDQSGDEGAVSVLEFTVAGRTYRVHGRGAYGVQWVGGSTALLYPPDHPEQARLADFKARFFIPLFLLIFGLVITVGLSGFGFASSEDGQSRRTHREP
jgi:hypothetical protein